MGESMDSFHAENEKGPAAGARSVPPSIINEGDGALSRLLEDVEGSTVALLSAGPSNKLLAMDDLAHAFIESCLRELDDRGAEINSQLLAALNVACEALTHCVDTMASSWAGVVVKWAVNVLGCICASDMKAVRSSLAGRISHWKNNCVTKRLVELLIHSMSAMMQLDPLLCVECLIWAVAHHAPHFDWIMALAGTTFSSSLIPALLRHGLNDFCKRHQQKDSRSTSQTPGQPTDSVNGESDTASNGMVQVLGHLVGKHAAAVRQALLDLFKSTFVGQPTIEQEALIPFLLHLAHQCREILHLVISDFLQLLTPEVLQLLFQQEKRRKARWPNYSITSALSATLSLLQADAEPVLHLVFSLTSSNADSGVSPDIQQACIGFMDNFLDELKATVYRRVVDDDVSTSLPALLLALQTSYVSLIDSVLVNSPGSQHRSRWCCELLQLVGLSSGELLSSAILSEILLRPSSAHLLSLFASLHKHFSAVYTSVLETCLQRVAPCLAVSSRCSQSTHQALNLLHNLEQLLVLEKGKTQRRFQSQLDCLLAVHTPSLASALEHADDGCDLATPALSLLDRLTYFCAAPPKQPSLVCSSHSARKGVSRLTEDITMLAACCRHGIAPKPELLVRLRHCRTFLVHISSHAATQPLLINLVFEAALEVNNRLKRTASMQTAAQPSGQTNGNSNSSLLNQNEHKDTRHMAVSHVGLIGNGAQPVSDRKSEQELVEARTTASSYFISVLTALCMSSSSPVPSRTAEDRPSLRLSCSALTALASAVVDFVMPAAVLPTNATMAWPEEESLKLTLESDVAVSQRFVQHPFLWQILLLLSREPSSLPPAAPLLRSLFAVQLQFWQRCRLASASLCSPELDASVYILTVMTKAGWLPPSLATAAEMLSFLTPYEIYLILSATWAFLRATWQEPGPKRDDPSASYAQTLKAVVHCNISALGHFYPQLSFLTAPAKDS